MPTEKLKSLIKPVVLTQRVIWFALVASMIFYIAFAYVFLTANRAITSNISAGYGFILYIVAAAAGIVSVRYYRKSLSEQRLRVHMSGEPDIEKMAADFRTKKVDGKRLSALRDLDAGELRIYSLVFELQKVTMIVMMLNELIIVCGLFLAFISDDAVKIIPFGAAALVLSIWMFPRPGRLIERAESGGF